MLSSLARGPTEVRPDTVVAPVRGQAAVACKTLSPQGAVR